VTESATAFGDALTAPFWSAAEARQLVVQRCGACGAFQFYPRPFCLACDAEQLDWVPVAGVGTVYAMTTVHLRVDPALEPPYVVALVELDEGPRLVTNLIGEPVGIGERVRVAWRERDGAPPLPVFERDGGAA
jgi:uncharacterized OB-fold protein